MGGGLMNAEKRRVKKSGKGVIKGQGSKKGGGRHKTYYSPENLNSG